MTTLWHYTCDHHHLQLGRRNVLTPGRDGFVWLTDLDHPYAAALGLTSVVLACDRTAHRYRVRYAADARPWTEVRREVNPVRREALESAPGVLPRHWWVATTLVPVVYDPDMTPVSKLMTPEVP